MRSHWFCMIGITLTAGAISCASHKGTIIPPETTPDGKIIGWGDLYPREGSSIDRRSYVEDGAGRRIVDDDDLYFDYKPLNEPADYPPEVAPARLIQFVDVGASPKSELMGPPFTPIPVFMDRTDPERIPGSERRVYRIEGTKGVKYGVATFEGTGPNRILMGVGLSRSGGFLEAYHDAKPEEWKTIVWREPISVAKTPLANFIIAQSPEAKAFLEEQCGRITAIQDRYTNGGVDPDPGSTGPTEFPTVSGFHAEGEKGAAYFQIETFTRDGVQYAQKFQIYPPAVSAALDARNAEWREELRGRS